MAWVYPATESRRPATISVGEDGSSSDGAPLTARTPMAVGSLTKAVTATAVMQLADQLGRPMSQPLGTVLADLTIIVVGLGISGTVGAGRWAARRTGRSRFATVFRLAWLALPMAFAATAPDLLGLVFGGRDVPGSPPGTAGPPFVIMVAAVGASALTTAAARLVALVRAARTL